MDDLRRALSSLDSTETPDLWPEIERRAAAPESATHRETVRFQTMYSATKLVVASVIVALFGGFLLAGVLTTQPSEGPVPAATTSGAGTFSPAGTLPEERGGHTATLLSDGRVLVLGGVRLGGSSMWDPTAVAWDPDRSMFSPAGSLAVPRVGYTATPLPDGRVLVVGGSSDTEANLTSAEIWDPETASFRATGSLIRGRYGHTATALPDGRVVVIGGETEDADEHPLVLPEVWDPATEAFSSAGSLAEVRFGHTATLLSDGRVLVVGGQESFMGRYKDSAVVWDPATASFGPAGSLAQGRGNLGWGDGIHTAMLLPDGRVLVVGGANPEGSEASYASAEIWDPQTASFSAVGSLLEGRLGHAASLLPDGRVLLVGGKNRDGDALATAEIWDPATTSFSPAGSLAEARFRGTATLLPDGRVLTIGGSSRQDGAWERLRTVEIWEPSAASE